MPREKVAVITGGGSGIGEAIVRLFSKQGYNVIVADIDPKAGSRMAHEINQLGGNAWFIQTDVTEEESVERLMREAVKKYGRLDTLVANAGIAEKKSPIHQLEFSEWSKVINIDLTGVALCNKHAVARMLENEGGVIINMASILSLRGQPESHAYSAAKAGVVNLTRSIALTYATQGIRANCVAPGYVDTPLLNTLPKSVTDTILQKQPMKRLAQPTEIAEVVAFLASDNSSIITGACISADGGYSAG